MVGIYKITNTLNNKCYIGQSIDIETRWLEHIYESKTLRHKYKIYLAIKKYGIKNFTFEILEKCSLNRKVLDERERYWIEYYNSYEEGYNMTKGGQGENSWIYDPQEIRQLWDEGKSSIEIAEILGCNRLLVKKRLRDYENYNSTLGKQRSILYILCSKEKEENKALSKIELMEKYGYDETGHFSLFRFPVEIHQYSLKGDYIASYNSIEQAAKELGVKSSCSISQAANPNDVLHKTAYGFQWRKEKKDKIPPTNTYNSRFVKCINTGEIFISIAEAARKYDISPSGIVACCKGQQKTSGTDPVTKERLKWQYLN